MSERATETTIKLDATPEQVWKAISEAEELARWFPPKARVEPGVGGHIWMTWSEDYNEPSTIEIWEPGKHLRSVAKREQPYSGKETKGSGPWLIASDYRIEAASGGSTTLRVVTSGFGDGKGWDEDYASYANGWEFELRSLRLYLSRHFGQDRETMFEMVTSTMSREEAWKTLTGPTCLCAQGSINGANEGDPYRFVTAAGDTYSGRVERIVPNRVFAGIVDELDGALFRVEIENFGGKAAPFAWLSVWGESRHRIEPLRDKWRSLMEGVFGDPDA